MNTIFIVLPILTLLMFDLGLVLRPSDFTFLLHHPRALVAGILGQIVLLPLIAWGVGSWFHLAPLFFIGVMLVACCPGGSSSNVFSMLAGGDVALSVSLTACSSVLTLFTLPLIMAFVTASTGAAIDVHLPIGNLLMQNLVLMVVPVVLGLIIAFFWKQIAAKIHNVLKRLAFPLLVVLVTIFFFQHKQTIIEEISTLGVCVSVLIIMAMSGGFLIAWLFRLRSKERRTLVIEVGMQNAAQAITIACSPFVFNNDIIAIPAIIYALLMNLLLLLYVGISKLHDRGQRA